MNAPKHIGIVGAGLVGTLLSIYLAKRGYRISLYERRGDIRKKNSDEGRSINLALSTRGIRALSEVGLTSAVKDLAIPMHGRVIHDTSGKLSFLPYGKEGQFINSVSRNGLNNILLDEAGKNGVRIFFDHRCVSVNLNNTSATFQTKDGKITSLDFDMLIGADGAFSAVRSAMQITDRYNYSQSYLEHGYKELQIPAGANGEFLLEKHALHIWPRESFMMIALPNPDATFTCTLFFPFEGDVSFASLSSDDKIASCFRKVFPDAVGLMPELLHDYKSNPTSSLVTIQCSPWIRNNTFLIGDAAHGIVPFYGQGMNAGFEDCRILNDLLDRNGDEWPGVLKEFQQLRKEDTDSIAQLAFDNFVEMRDLVADPEFLLRKKIEAKLHDLYPEKWIPLYTMVTFRDDIRYSQAYHAGRKQARIMDEVMRQPGIAANWQDLNFREIVERLN